MDLKMESALKLALGWLSSKAPSKMSSLLLQLRLKSETGGMDSSCPSLLGVVMRGMTFEGERWRLATVGDWLPAGPHLPQQDQVEQLQLIGRELFEVFEQDVSNRTCS